MARFNKSKFAKLLKQAVGTAELHKYATKRKIGAKLLEKYFLGIRDSKPAPLLVYKMASNASNNITFDELMLAAGYNEKQISIFKEENKIDVVNIENKKKDYLKKKGKLSQTEILVKKKSLSNKYSYFWKP